MFKKISPLSGLGTIICGAYLILYYLVPLSVGYFYEYSYLEFYKGSPQFFYVLPAVILYFICFLFIYKYIPEIKTPLKRVYIRTFSRPYLNLLITLLFLYFSVKFYFEYGLSYRQVGSQISESSGYVILLTMLKIYFSMFIFCKMADLSFSLKLHKVDVITLSLGALSFYFASSAAFDMLKILVSILLIYMFYSNLNVFVAQTHKMSLFRRTLKIIVYGCMLTFIFVATLYFGLANKMGYESAYELIFGGTLLEFIVIPLSRLSVHFYTLAYHLTYNIFNFDFQFETLPNVIENLTFRLSHLFGFDYQKPDIVSSARLNSLSIYYDPRETNGATPGLIGSIFFIPFFPVSIFISLFYVCFILKKVEQIFNNHKRASLISILYMVSLVQAFTDAQIDLLNFVGVSGVSLFLLYLAWFDRPEFRISSQKLSHLQKNSLKSLSGVG